MLKVSSKFITSATHISELQLPDNTPVRAILKLNEPIIMANNSQMSVYLQSVGNQAKLSTRATDGSVYEEQLVSLSDPLRKILDYANHMVSKSTLTRKTHNNYKWQFADPTLYNG